MLTALPPNHMGNESRKAIRMIVSHSIVVHLESQNRRKRKGTEFVTVRAEFGRSANRFACSTIKRLYK